MRIYHCPDRGGPSADIPDLFYEAVPAGPGYARDADISLLDAGNDRTQAVQTMQRGAIRTLLGMLPSALAVLDALVQLVFSLCLIALWVGLPIGLVFVFFAQTTSGVTGLFRRMLGVVQVSWSSSVLLGLVAACLIAAAELRNAAAYTGFAIGGLILTAFLLITAVDTLKDSVRTLNATVTTATGLSITRPFTLAGEAATAAIGIGAAAASGGAATALTAAAAMRQTGSGRYAAATAIGRIRPVAQLGEVAAALGVLQDDELLEGLYAGQRSTFANWRGTRLQMQASAQRVDAAGRTFRDRAQERALTRELARVQQPTVVQELGNLSDHGRAIFDYIGSAQMAADVVRAGDWLPERIDAGWKRIRGTWHTFHTTVDAASGGAPDLLHRSAAAAQVLDEWLRPGRRGAVIALDARGRITYDALPAELPAHALTAPRSQVRIPRLLLLGYQVHERDGGTVAFWRHDDATAPARPTRLRPTPGDDERGWLIQAGGLIAGANVSPAAQADSTRGAETLEPPPGQAEESVVARPAQGQTMADATEERRSRRALALAQIARQRQARARVQARLQAMGRDATPAAPASADRLAMEDAHEES